MNRMLTIALGMAMSLNFQSVMAQLTQLNSLQEAEQLALERDFLLKSIDNQKQSQLDNSRAALEWQDPAIKFGISNLPTDTFSFDQEAMTQLKLGITQQFPQGDTLAIKSKRFELAALEKDYDVQVRIRKILKAVRLSWLDILFQQQAYSLLQNNHKLFLESRDLINLTYASGRSNQQDIYQMELEISILEDKLDDNRMKLSVALDELKRWIGQDIAPEMVAQNSDLLVAQQLPEHEQQVVLLDNHPSLLKISQKKEQSKQGIQLSKQKYKPKWAVDVSYGKRLGDNPDGSSRSDFLSAMVNMKYPVWGAEKQDHLLASSQQQLLAVNFTFDDKKIELQRDLLQTNSQIKRLHKRINNYEMVILDKAANSKRFDLIASVSP